MQLSLLEDRAAIRTLHAALDAGVRWLDTADVYAPDADHIGHNERLIARALAEWSGPRGEVVVATKGGLTRRGARWIPNGRAKHLRGAVEASLNALGQERLDVYQLHVPDPKTPLSTSVRALHAMRKAGQIGRVGLSNVSVEQIDAARDITAIDVVQIELSVLSSEGFESGVAEHCRELGIRLVAHRPLGGAKNIGRIRKDPILKSIAARLEVSPEDIALAWLYDLDPTLIVIPGATREVTASRAHAVTTLALTDEDRARLDERFPAGRLLRIPRARRRPMRPAGDVVIVMGAPGAGKTSRAAAYESRGYARLNRDDRGGRLAGLIPRLESLLSSGVRNVVLDNTYPKRASRNRVIETAWRHEVGVRCDWMCTSIEDAQINAVRRMIDRHGRLLDADAIADLKASEPNTFLPNAQFRYRDWFERPTLDEGFERVDVHEFERQPLGERAAIIVDADAHLLRSRAGHAHPFDEDDLEVQDSLLGAIREAIDDGYVVAAIAWLPGATDTEAIVSKLRETIAIDLEVCNHEAGPPRCWCRRPFPGLGVVLAERHGIDLTKSFLVGEGPTNRTFATRLSMTLWTVDDLLNRRARDRA